MGGRLALHAALQTDEPQRGLILIGASPGLREGPEKEIRRRWDLEQAESIQRNGAPLHMETWQSHPLIASQAKLVDPATYQYMMNRRREASADGLASSFRRFGAGTMPDCWEALPGLKTPTLLVVGAEDARYRAIAEEMQDLLPNAHLLIVANAGHAAHLENPADFLDGVHHWMSGR
jgi:2-succinyl-6-hydroxy-2,4-cyclohexadiene-1-carboxylate synthase